MYIQRYNQYTSAEQATWFTLYNRQLNPVEKFAYKNFMRGLHQLGFTAHAIPDFGAVNARLKPITGWTIYAVPGLIDNKFFFEQMYDKKFGATTWIRKPEQLDYLEEPDMFHDVFGHVPLLADQYICDYLHGLAVIADKYINNEDVIESIARLYWYTIEFGLILENEALKIYGAGILSSIGETEYCLSGKPGLEPFNILKIIDTPYIKDSYQQQYFVLNSMRELAAALPVLENHFRKTVTA